MGMKIGHCSTELVGTRNTTFNVVKVPTITMGINNTEKSYKEGTQLKLTCNAAGGVPNVRSYSWWIGSEKLNYTSRAIEYSANRTHNNMNLRCEVDHRAFDSDIYNNKFLKHAPVKLIPIDMSLFSFAWFLCDFLGGEKEWD